MRIELRKFRQNIGFTQEELANKIGFSRQYYTAVELGQRNGSLIFWTALQKQFHLEDNEVWNLTKKIS